MSFIGRKEELAALRAANWSESARLIALYGRRRVGKSRLVEEAFRDDYLLSFDGLEGQNQRAQLTHFLNRLNPHLQRQNLSTKKKFKDWHEALDALCELAQKTSQKQLVILFDEFQWMAEMKSPLVSIFKSYWDNSFVKLKNLKFILCGSVSSFIVRKVIKSKALYGRIDLELQLLPFSTHETQQYLGRSFSVPDTLKAALTLGGIPEYLEKLDPKQSLIQNLSSLAFSKHGYFFREYERIFVSHFGVSEVYRKIIEELSGRPLSHGQLLTTLEGTSGGSFSSRLDDLVLAGFVERYVPVEKTSRSKLVYYRLNDEYLHFYFTFIKRWHTEIERGEVLPEQILLGKSYEQWLGYAFERLCRKNAHCIAEKLRFSGISYRVGSWFRRDTQSNAQIDLLFIRADKVALSCELKHSMSISLGDLSSRLERQRSALLEAFPRHALQTALITAEPLRVSEPVRKLFTHVLSASEVFFAE